MYKELRWRHHINDVDPESNTKRHEKFTFGKRSSNLVPGSEYGQYGMSYWCPY